MVRFHFSLRRLMLALSCLGVACAMAVCDPAILFPASPATGMVSAAVIKPLLIGAIAGTALGIVIQHPFLGLVVGYLLAIPVALELAKSLHLLR